MILATEGMREEDNEPITYSTIELPEKKVERYVGTWMMAILARYESVRFVREREGSFLFVLALGEDGGKVGSVTLSGLPARFPV